MAKKKVRVVKRNGQYVCSPRIEVDAVIERIIQRNNEKVEKLLERRKERA